MLLHIAVNELSTESAHLRRQALIHKKRAKADGDPGPMRAGQVGAVSNQVSLSSVITLNPAIRDRVKSGHREWPKT